jgi:hypothetical protein
VASWKLGRTALSLRASTACGCKCRRSISEQFFGLRKQRGSLHGMRKLTDISRPIPVLNRHECLRFKRNDRKPVYWQECPLKVPGQMVSD